MENRFTLERKDFNAKITERARISLQHRAQIEALEKVVADQKELLTGQPTANRNLQQARDKELQNAVAERERQLTEDFTRKEDTFKAKVTALETEVAELRELVAQRNAEINSGK